MTLARKSQLAAAVEDVEGVEKTLTSSNLIEVLADTFPNAELTFEAIERNTARGSLSPQEAMAGRRSGTITAQAELAGPSNGNPATAPPWARLMRASGMREDSIRKVGVGASWTGGDTVRHGETFTADVSGATGFIVGTRYEGEDTYVTYRILTGNITGSDTEIVTSGGVTIPLVSPGTLGTGRAWYPDDIILSSIATGAVTSGPINPGDEVVGGTSGARARVGNDAAYAGPGLLLLEMYVGSVQFQNGETISVVGGSATCSASGAPVQSRNPSLTVATLHQGLRKKILGARGNWTARFQSGDRGILTFEMRGKGVQVADAYNFDWPGAQMARPPKVVGSQLLIDGTYVPEWDSLEIASQNELTLRDSQSDASASGYSSTRIVARSPRVTFGKQTVREAIWPMYGRNYTKDAIRVKYRIGTDAANGNYFEFLLHHVQIDSIRELERSGILNSELTCMARSPALGNDEVVLIEL